MSNQRRFLSNDYTHTNLTSERWSSKYEFSFGGRPEQYSEITKKEGTSPACFKCRYYIELSGELGRDWGMCSNEKSLLDGKLMFEHDSCDQFSFASDEEDFK